MITVFFKAYFSPFHSLRSPQGVKISAGLTCLKAKVTDQLKEREPREKSIVKSSKCMQLFLGLISFDYLFI